MVDSYELLIVIWEGEPFGGRRPPDGCHRALLYRASGPLRERSQVARPRATRRHADHFALMSRRLTELGDDLRRAVNLERVRDLAPRIEAEFQTESDAWTEVCDSETSTYSRR